MIALELSGVHIGSLLRIKFKALNKDGSVRKNAKEHHLYVVPSRVYHNDDGNVELGAFWFTDKPEPIPSHWKNNTNWMRTYTYKGHRINSGRVSAPRVPFNAEIEIIDG